MQKFFFLKFQTIIFPIIIYYIYIFIYYIDILISNNNLLHRNINLFINIYIT